MSSGPQSPREVACCAGAKTAVPQDPESLRVGERVLLAGRGLSPDSKPTKGKKGWTHWTARVKYSAPRPLRSGSWQPRKVRMVMFC